MASNRIKRVNETGDMESLGSIAQSGRPARLSAGQKAEIKPVLQDSPERHSISTNIWDRKILSAYILEHYGITLKTRSCQNLFHELGFSLKRARSVVVRGDEKQKEESKKLKKK
jgi:transposase